MMAPIRFNNGRRDSGLHIPLGDKTLEDSLPTDDLYLNVYFFSTTTAARQDIAANFLKRRAL